MNCTLPLKSENKQTTPETKDFLNAIDISKLSEDKVKLCEEEIYKSLKSM